MTTVTISPRAMNRMMLLRYPDLVLVQLAVSGGVLATRMGLAGSAVGLRGPAAHRADQTRQSCASMPPVSRCGSYPDRTRQPSTRASRMSRLDRRQATVSRLHRTQVSHVAFRPHTGHG